MKAFIVVFLYIVILVCCYLCFNILLLFFLLKFSVVHLPKFRACNVVIAFQRINAILLTEY